MKQGWECPKCKKVYAPWMPSCNCNTTVTSSNTTSNFTVSVDDATLIDNMCMSYCHDFGLMAEQDRQALRFECAEWLRAYRNNTGL